MLKFLRKYRTILLGMFVVILMVAFVAPQAIQQLGPNPLKQKAGSISGVAFTVGDLQQAASEVRMLETISPAIPVILGLDTTRQPEHWMLLKSEAKAAGLVGEIDDGRDWVSEVAAQIARISLTQQYGRFGQQWVAMMMQDPQVQQEIAGQAQGMLGRVASAAGNNRLTEQDGLRALAAARGITRLKDAYVFAARPTREQAVTAARTIGDSATIDYLFIPARTLLNEIDEPSEADLAAHYEAFASVEPGTGDFGIGYMRPARIKIEWLVIDRTAIAGAIPVDRVELRKLYESNRAKYSSEYEIEREIVRADYLSAKTAELMSETLRIVRAEVLKATRRLESQDTYKKLPESWADERPRLEQIALTIVESLRTIKGVSIPLPRVESRDANWLDATDLSMLPGIGSSVVRLGSVQAPFAQYALQVKELDGNPTLGLQVGLTPIDNPLEDASGNVYFFTVLEARPPSPPDGIADVATLRDDWKAIKAYERLVGELGIFETLARTDSLDAAARLVDTDGTRLLFPTNAVTISRNGPATSDTAIQTRAFTDAVMDAVTALDPRLSPEALASEPGAVLGIPLPNQPGIAVVRIRSIVPYTIERFRAEAVGIVAQSIASEVEKVAGTMENVNPFTYQAMVTRLKFETPGSKQAGES
ncbi:MAG: hypothetical protein KF902_10100 [Phycisphaeraceae bacterium]|nr:hypothetical protein [Phycisphaeraceae bacterium]